MGTSADDIKGRAKVAAGAVTGNEELENEGQKDRAAAQIKEQVDKVTDMGRDAVASAQEAASDLADKGREAVDAVVEKAKAAADKVKGADKGEDE
jgi:uncharacterized protein YjbJ (UPF0337 family)